jgi:MFS family permease
VLCKDTGLWRIALYGGIMYLPAGMLGSLWGVNFILAADPTLSLAQAAMINSLIFLGWIIGSPLVGLSSDLFRQRKIFLQLGALLCLVLLGALYSNTHFNALALTSIFLGLGIFSSFSGLTFVMGVERHTTTRAMTIGWINMWAIIPMLIMNPLFGHVLDYFWQGQVSNQGVHVFSLNSYQLALWPLMALIAIALALSFGRFQDKSIHII